MSYLLIFSKVKAFQIITDLSNPTVTSKLPSGDQQMSCISLSCATNLFRTVQCSRSCSSVPNSLAICVLSFSQIKQILSSEPRASHLPSGENFKEVTTPLCLDMEQSGRRKDLSGNDSSSLVEVESFLDLWG